MATVDRLLQGGTPVAAQCQQAAAAIVERVSDDVGHAEGLAELQPARRPARSPSHGDRPSCSCRSAAPGPGPAPASPPAGRGSPSPPPPAGRSRRRAPAARRSWQAGVRHAPSWSPSPIDRHRSRASSRPPRPPPTGRAARARSASPSSSAARSRSPRTAQRRARSYWAAASRCARQGRRAHGRRRSVHQHRGTVSGALPRGGRARRRPPPGPASSARIRRCRSVLRCGGVASLTASRAELVTEPQQPLVTDQQPGRHQVVDDRRWRAPPPRAAGRGRPSCRSPRRPGARSRAGARASRPGRGRRRGPRRAGSSSRAEHSVTKNGLPPVRAWSSPGSRSEPSASRATAAPVSRGRAIRRVTRCGASASRTRRSG